MTKQKINGKPYVMVPKDEWETLLKILIRLAEQCDKVTCDYAYLKKQYCLDNPDVSKKVLEWNSNAN